MKLVGKREWRRPLGSGWEDNIKMGLKEIGLDGVNWLRTASSGGLLLTL
jgi:hypothetical protein